MYIALSVDGKMSVDGKIEKYRDFYNIGGWQKLIALPGNTAEPIADSSTHQLKNPPYHNLLNSTQNQSKSQIFNLKPVIVPHIVKIKQNQYFYICQNLFLKDSYF